MAEASPDFLKELHVDLARKWKVHGPKIEKTWRSMDGKTRLEAIKSGAADGVVLKNPSDSSLGNVHKFIPEWNTQEVAAPGSDFLLDMLRFRATNSLEEQYRAGFNGRPGDYDLIVESMQKKNLRHKDPFTDCYTFFMDGENMKYGQSYRVKMDKEATLKAFGPAIMAGVCVPQAIGELVLTRQTFLLQCLNIIIGDILELGSKTRNTKKMGKRAVDSATDSMAKLSVHHEKAELPDVISTSSDHATALEAHLDLLRTEPVALEYVVNGAFYTRPELVPDEKGRMLPALNDRFLSGAVLDAVHGAVKNAATWRCISQILDIYSKNTDKSSRATAAQELANICQSEYTRCQNAMKRALGTSLGTKWLKRMSNGSDNGVARLAIKGDPNLLTREDPLLHYLLRLCQPETTAAKAVDWIEQLDGLRQSHPMQWERLTNPIYYALGELISIALFTQSLSQAISLPAFSRKKGQQFVAETAKLETEVNKIKPELDLTEFAAPMENLLEPGMAEGALRALDEFIVDKMGTKIGFLYEDLIKECIQNLEQVKKESQATASAEQKDAFVPLPATDAAAASSSSSSSAEVQVQQRREKAKTRPAQPSIFDITASPNKSAAGDSEASPGARVPGAPRLGVKPSTAETFGTIFNKSEKRSPVPWTAFEAAMVDAGFSVIPKEGSIITFQSKPGPASTEAGAKSNNGGDENKEGGKNASEEAKSARHLSITIHRPHGVGIEGYDLLYLASRLHRGFGWGAQTFEAKS